MLSGILLGFAIAKLWEKPNVERYPAGIIPSNDTECKNLNLFNTSYCLRDNLREWFNYNISNVGKNLTLDELKQEGGVCQHYAEWYSAQMKSLGFHTQEIIIDTDGTLHEFTIASNYEGYCLADQRTVVCYRLTQTKDLNRY